MYAQATTSNALINQSFSLNIVMLLKLKFKDPLAEQALLDIGFPIIGQCDCPSPI
jgi:hypothetical protein